MPRRNVPSDPPEELLPPSRSQQRRDALEIFKLAETLASLSDAQLLRLALADELRAEVVRTRAITSHIARKRETQFLAKQLRKLDESELEPIRATLEHDRAQAHQDAAALHKLEAWRLRLIDEGDTALDELIALYPSADRQRLRQLARNARVERDAGKPLHAYRELFRALRDLLL
ncbi:MAG TPA: ribosome biogenesis factor YjgA [Rhodanobacteraceae bacterium]|jgi:ribosome-associated protein|nr:ribosome biogenesis factor YjgA [Rhodanobacteraceae bacterium]